MSARELLRNGQLTEAIAVVVAEVRENPTDTRSRTFLFELLCFAGQLDRAGRQLTAISDDNPEVSRGVLFYRSALSASRKREELFENRDYPKSVGALRRPGTLNGVPFETIEDCDGRIGARLEMFVAGECIWLPFEHLGTLEMTPPQLLRDTIWPSAQVTTSSSLAEKDFGEVMLPVLYPGSAKHPQDAVKLGRETVWSDGDLPFGQKLLLLDGELVVPYLEIRDLRFHDSATSAENAADAAYSNQ